MNAFSKSFFSFCLLCLAPFVQVPLYAYDFLVGEYVTYDYSLQFIFCFILALIFRKEYALFGVVLYLIFGLIGFPIFANGGGLSYFLEPSLGYLLALVLLVIFTVQFKNISGFLFFPLSMIRNSAPFAILIAHVFGLLFLFITARMNIINILHLSMFQIIYDFVFAVIVTMLLSLLMPKSMSPEIEEQQYQDFDLQPQQYI